MPHRRLFVDLVLGCEPKLRRRVQMCLTSAGTYVLYAGIQALQVHFGFASAFWSTVCVLASLVSNVSFYVLIRRGWSQRIAKDPSLGTAQLLVGFVFFWLTYAVNGPGSLTTPVIIASHVVYAMFGLPARQVRRLAALSLGGLVLLMVVCHALAPDRYPAQQQMIAALYTSLVVMLIVRLASQVSALHDRVRSQRNQLEAALGQVQALAGRDELTQLPNRRSMHGLLQQLRPRPAHDAAPDCLAMIDIDHFKRINDEHGHAAGDEVLRRFAKVGAGTLRTSDSLGRWGGEEFLLLMPRTSPADAQAVLQRLHALLAAADLGPPGHSIRVTFSAGLTPLAAGETVEHCLARADRALYRAKQSGRDRTECDGWPLAAVA